MHDWDEWLPAVLGEGPVDLIGHSLGSAAAVVAADRFTDRVSSLTLVSPFFLQPPARPWARVRPLVRAFLRHSGAARLSHRLTGSEESALALASSAADLRHRTAGRAAEQLVRAGSPQWRAELREALARVAAPVRIITGDDDPLAPELVAALGARRDVELVTVQGAGHHPQLTHGNALVGLLGAGAREGHASPAVA